MTDAERRVPNEGQDVADATEPAPEDDQLGEDGNPFKRVDAAAGSPAPDTADAESSEHSSPADSGADFGMGIPAANDPQQAPDGPGPT